MSVKELSHLEETNLFQDLDKDVIREISEKARVREFKRKEIISFSEDRDVIFIIKKGRVKTSYLSEDGREITILILNSGDVYSRHSQALVRAVIKTEIWQFTSIDFLAILEKDPKIPLRLIRILGRILKQTNEAIQNLAFQEVTVRLARFLLRQAQEYGTKAGTDIIIEMELTHEDVAALIVTSRQTVTSILGRMEKSGTIIIEKKRMYIKNIANLEEMGHPE